MYPKRDFRYLIHSGEPSGAIRALSREPFTEILKYWKAHGQHEYFEGTDKGKELHSIYSQGIQEGVAKERYACFLIDKVEHTPEFYSAVKQGLIKSWCRLRFSLDYDEDNDTYSLYIGSIQGQDIFIPDQDKTRMIELIMYRLCFPLYIDNQLINVGVFPSRKAEHISQKVYWLQKAIYRSTLKSI